MSGVKAVSWRSTAARSRPTTHRSRSAPTATHTLEYRAIDKAGDPRGLEVPDAQDRHQGPDDHPRRSTGTAGRRPGHLAQPVTVTPSVKDDALRRRDGKTVSVDGGASAAAGRRAARRPAATATTRSPSPRRTSRAIAASATATFTIDTSAPVVELPAPPATPPTVTPNGDATGEQVALPFTVSEPGSLVATIADADADGRPDVQAGERRRRRAPLAWDGRTAAGAPVPDGAVHRRLPPRPTPRATTAPRSRPRSTSTAPSRPLTRTPTLFFPQDEDALARSATATCTLLAPATVSIRVLDASGQRRPRADEGQGAPGRPRRHGAGTARPTPAPGRRAASTGSSSRRPTARRRREPVRLTLTADAFRLTTSVTTATRGKPITITAHHRRGRCRRRRSWSSSSPACRRGR